MAKKKEKTLEEKLQEALVPENQWPYILPENWCWLQISKLYDVGSSKRIHKSDWIDKGIPFIRTRELVKLSETGYVDNDLFISELLYEELKAKYGVPKYGDILISGVGTIGVPYIVKGKKQFYFKDGNVIWLKPKVKINASYIFWLYKSQFVINQIKAMSSGTTVDTYTITNANNTLLPIPPLLEQKRIVHRIESLFAKLDEAKEKIQQVLDGAEMRKAAILHKAFTGELTKNWRKENGISEDSWVEYTLQSVCTMKITDGTHKTPTYSDKENGVVFLSAKDITSGEINWENTKYITSELHKELYSRLAPQINDILLAKNGTTGVAALVKEDKVFDIYVTLALLRPNVEIVIPEYLLNIINSPLCKVQFNENLTGIGVPNLHLRDIKDVKIKVPSISEQEIISDKVEMLLANEGMVTKNCLKQIEVIDTMKKSILAKAFRGELGKNNPTEDSALNLLKEVLQDKS